MALSKMNVYPRTRPRSPKIFLFFLALCPWKLTIAHPSLRSDAKMFASNQSRQRCFTSEEGGCFFQTGKWRSRAEVALEDDQMIAHVNQVTDHFQIEHGLWITRRPAQSSRKTYHE